MNSINIQTIQRKKLITLTIEKTKNIHIQETNTRYLSFMSRRHPRILTGIVKCLHHRAKGICDQEYIEPELKHLTEALKEMDTPKD